MDSVVLAFRRSQFNCVLLYLGQLMVITWTLGFIPLSVPSTSSTFAVYFVSFAATYPVTEDICVWHDYRRCHALFSHITHVPHIEVANSH